MKIGIGIYNFNPKKGGAERYAYDLAVMLTRRGHEVTVFCSSGIEIPGVRIVRLDSLPYPRWLRSLTFALNHRKHVRSFGLDVVLGFGNTLDLDVYQSHGGVQKIWMEREIASYDNPGERRLKALLLKASINQKIQAFIAEYPVKMKRFSRIVAISDMVKGHMAKYYSLKDEDFDVIYNGVDTVRFRPAERPPEGEVQILFSAGNFRLKGLLPLLLAAGELAKGDEGFHVTVMGRGRRQRYSRVIEESNLKERVIFLGETASPDGIYRTSHVLAHPTYYDACSLTTMEAMASGVPVITTKWNGASALVSGDEGFVIDGPDDVAALAEALRRLLDRGVREEMGRRSRQKLEGYTMERNVEAMDRVFHEVCDGKRRN
jgi:UDP-glucose:(heptosyl)LPS alpha-1,3-glucosyltransferase